MSYLLVILFIAALHITWGLALIMDPAAGNTTAIYSIIRLMPTLMAGFMLVAAGALSIVSLYLENLVWRMLCFAPQQFLLLVSAGGAIEAIVASQFADGVVRPRAFIFADKVNIILAAIMHFIVIINLIRGKTWIGQRQFR